MREQAHGRVAWQDRRWRDSQALSAILREFPASARALKIPLHPFASFLSFSLSPMAAVQEMGDVVKAVADNRDSDEKQLQSKQNGRHSFVRSNTDMEDSRTVIGLDGKGISTEKGAIDEERRQASEKQESPSRTPAMIKKERWQLFSLCFSLFLAGWDGGTPGPLIPRLQIFYDVSVVGFSPLSHADTLRQLNYLVVSLIFVMNCIVRLSRASRHLS